MDVALATCVVLPEPDPDAAPLARALEAAGVRARELAWDDPAADFAAARLTLLRSTWNYPSQPDAFLAWAERTALLAEGGADDVYAITNNHYRAQAAVNAIQLKGMLRDEPMPAPDTLYAQYEEELRGWAYPD